jgi:hypothetical protein
MLTFFDIIYADTRGSQWGSESQGAASTLSAAAGQYCLEGSRVVTVGRRLVDEEGVWAFTLLDTLELSCGDAGFIWSVTRSCKSTPPDRSVAAASAYAKGNWVKLVGLKKAADLNGSQAVILEVPHYARMSACPCMRLCMPSILGFS